MQLPSLSQWSRFLENIHDINCKNIVFDENFNAYLDCKLESQGWKPTLKKQTVAKIIETLENMWNLANQISKVKTLYFSAKPLFKLYSNKVRFFLYIKYYSSSNWKYWYSDTSFYWSFSYFLQSLETQYLTKSKFFANSVIPEPPDYVGKMK